MLFDPKSSLKVSRVLHAGYVFESDQTQIIFDPIFENPFSRNCHAFPDLQFDHEQIKQQKFTAVFISHFHDDHCSFESLNFLDKKTPIYMFCVFEEMFDLIRQLGFTNVYSLQLNKPVVIGEFKITALKALDEDVDSIFHIQAAGLNILNVVDSWIDDDTLSLLKLTAPWDMVLWPFQTMREVEVIAPSRASAAPQDLPEEWIAQLKILNPKFIVPSSCQFKAESWSWYNQAFFPVSYKQFQRQMELALPQAKVVRLNPSVSVILTKDSVNISKPISWITPIGPQDVDYDYQTDINPPSTSEIAKRFAPLTSEQKKIVLDYCQFGLIQKYKSMEPAVDPYFKKTRAWKLSIYEHDGKLTHFYYRLNGVSIEIVDEIPKKVEWTTDVSIAKVYAALVLGESLTSMYMRINDVTFDSETEKEIADADIVDDPLIRCLFNGAFATYQKAQLERIRSFERRLTSKV